MNKCPICSLDKGHYVMYKGLPMFLCRDDNCACVWGFWSFVPIHIHFDGFFVIYTGSYLVALYNWLKGEIEF